uniref:DNA polymerase I n=1 Tax=Candidatus Scatomorpha intestinigallinarum TaxID=2840923 RepID=UPI004027B6A6
MKKLMILDGNSVVNRAFYGVRPLNAPDGTPTNAVYGFLAILQKLFEGEAPDSLCVAFDLPAPTFRHEMYEGYKAQRKPMPEELAVQMPLLKETLDAMHIRRLEAAGWEADDVLGAVSAICEKSGWACEIVTGDKDSFQLITETTSVLHVKSRMGQTETILYDRARFEEEYGFAPPLMVDLKALMGDASDNIPGVPGIGEKTALDLVRRYGRVADIYAGLDSLDIKDSVRKKLAAGRESAEMSYTLATISREAPVELKPEDASWSRDFGPELYAVLDRLGFRRFIEKWGLAPAPEAVQEAESRAMPELSALTAQEAEARIRAAETLGLALPGDDLDSLSLCDGEAIFTLNWGELGEDYNRLLRLVFSPEVKKSAHGVKDLMGLALAEGLGTEGFVFDTELAAYVLDPTESGYDLGKLTKRYLGAELPEARAALELMAPMRAKLAENGAEKLYFDIELPLCQVLAEMERAGFLVDRKALADFGESLTAGIDALQRGIWELAGHEFNINSPKQLGEVLFDELMLPAGKKTKTGWSTNADILEKLIGKHPIIGDILEYRMLTKLKSTYADGLLKVISADGRIHTNFRMTVTATGRLSSTEPNLQNIPVRRELGAQIRRMFVAAPGCVLVDADYSQIELRLLAHISGDETMQNAFKSGEDIHAVTASQVFGLPLAEVTPAQRSSAKAVNFGIVYGISAFSLAQDIKVSPAEARAYIDAYMQKYHGVREYMDRVIAEAKERGYVETLFGRRRPVPELKASNFNTRSFGERVARNMPIQGTAADIIKLAMVNVRRRLRAEGLEARLILQVHDELIAECPEREAERVAALLEEEMERAVTLSVPLTAEAHSGHSWAEAH